MCLACKLTSSYMQHNCQISVILSQRLTKFIFLFITVQLPSLGSCKHFRTLPHLWQQQIQQIFDIAWSHHKLPQVIFYTSQARKHHTVNGRSTINYSSEALPDTKCPIFCHKFKHSNQLQSQGITSPPASHILLLSVNSFTDVYHQFLHQVPKKVKVFITVPHSLFCKMCNYGNAYFINSLTEFLFWVRNYSL